MVAGASLLAARDAVASRHVVLVVDTSASMARENDPNRRAVLTALILGDMLDAADRYDVVRFYAADDFPTTPTGSIRPCPDDPSRQCSDVRFIGDPVDIVKRSRTGVVTRANDRAAFQRELQTLLAYDKVFTDYDLPLRVAAMLFEEQGANIETERVLIFLSDGRPTSAVQSLGSVQQVFARMGVVTVSIGVGPEARDVPELKAIGRDSHRFIARAEDLVSAVADVYNRLLGSLRTDSGAISGDTAVALPGYVEQAAFLFYSDQPFQTARILSADGREIAGARYVGGLPSGGHYAIVLAESPPAGTYRLSGEGASAMYYAVIQRSSLTAKFLGPRETQVGTTVALTASLVVGRGSAEQIVTAADVLSGTSVRFSCGQLTVALQDEGQSGDVSPGDGVFSAMYRFEEIPAGPCHIDVRNRLVERRVPAEITVLGRLELTGPASVNFGTITAGSSACRQAQFTGDIVGRFDLALNPSAALPSGVYLADDRQRVREPGEVFAVTVDSNQREARLCIETGRGTAALNGASRPIRMTVSAPGSSPLTSIDLVVTVIPLTFWERWGWLIITLLVILLVAFVVAGYMVPPRFARRLALLVAEGVQELTAATPVGFSSVRGTGRRFWRPSSAGLSIDGVIGSSARASLLLLRADHVAGRVRVFERGGRLIVQEPGAETGWRFACNESTREGWIEAGRVYGFEGQRLCIMLMFV